MRLIIEAFLLFLLAHRLLPHKPGFLFRLSAAAATGYFTIYAVTFSQNLAIRSGLLILAMLVFGYVSWRVGLEHEKRAFMRQGSPTKASTMPNVL